jgi:hypothetical protein
MQSEKESTDRNGGYDSKLIADRPARLLSWGPIAKQTKNKHERQKNFSQVAFLSYY